MRVRKKKEISVRYVGGPRDGKWTDWATSFPSVEICYKVVVLEKAPALPEGSTEGFEFTRLMTKPIGRYILKRGVYRFEKLKAVR